MDNALGMASTANNNTEDALVDSSPPGAQADDDHVQIVSSPQAIEERTFLKCKSNDGDDQQNKQKKQRKHPAISNKQQKHPAISDTNLEKQVNWVRDVSLQNVVDSSLQATQSLDFDNNDGTTEVINEVTKYFTMNVTYKKSSQWWEEFVLNLGNIFVFNVKVIYHLWVYWDSSVVFFPSRIHCLWGNPLAASLNSFAVLFPSMDSYKVLCSLGRNCCLIGDSSLHSGTYLHRSNIPLL